MSSKSTFISSISKKEFPLFEKVSGVLIKDPILSLIQKEYPFFNSDSMLALSELNVFREQYITSYLEREINEISSIERKVIQSLKEEKSLVTEIEDAPDSRTYGQIVADKVADFGGSWTFIISFMFFLFGWIIVNVVVLVDKGFDPYPFILLNLILSCIAALQAPVIMMSQNRQEEKDRERSKKDFMINLKSELEIRMLHEKLDHLIMHQQQELIEIQKIQIDMMNDILERIKK
ncbi:DUF1003 domain-containing protein [Flavobacterium sp.]|uniref:DUF1003 domain-containing protein n=1 Tax=Flavobacterium sp. TaxID=239 RepID=UPI0025C69521|nr:DUF1003 domain-containing protein [Flavobacterium sp.]